MSTRSYLTLVMAVAVAMPGIALVYSKLHRERRFHGLKSLPWEFAVYRHEDGISTGYRIYESGSFAVLDFGKVRIAVPGGVPLIGSHSGEMTIRRSEAVPWTSRTTIRGDTTTAGKVTGAARHPGSLGLASRQGGESGVDLDWIRDGGLQGTFNGIEFTVDEDGTCRMGSLTTHVESATVLLIEPERDIWTVLRSDDPRCADLVGVERRWRSPETPPGGPCLRPSRVRPSNRASGGFPGSVPSLP